MVTSDASGSYGCSAFSTTHGWFQLEWPDSWTAIGIAAKELVPVVIAAALWGANWNRACVCFRSDNQAVVEILTSRTSKDHLLMHLVRCLVFYAAFFGFQFVAQHVPGTGRKAVFPDVKSRYSTGQTILYHFLHLSCKTS